MMIARGAINNPLIFSPPTDFNELNIMRQYVQHVSVHLCAYEYTCVKRSGKLNQCVMFERVRVQIARFCGMNVKSIRKSACFCICEV